MQHMALGCCWTVQQPNETVHPKTNKAVLVQHVKQEDAVELIYGMSSQTCPQHLVSC